MRRLTIKIRITLWYAAFLLLLLVIFNFFLYFTISRLLYNHAEDLIKADAGQVESIIQLEGSSIKIAEPYKIIATNTYFVVFDAKGNTGLMSEGMPEALNMPLQKEQTRYIFQERHGWAVYDKPLILDGNTIGWIRIGRSLDSLLATLQNLKLIMFISVPLYILLATLGGLFLAGRALRPIDYITRTARDISKGDMVQRLNMPAAKDEVGRLATTFNEMLDKLEAFIKKERQFSSDASHELRTPISIISAQAQQALAGKRGASEYVSALKSILKESKKMSYIITQLLMLYRSDEGKYDLSFEPLDLNLITEEVVNEYKNISIEKDISINFKMAGSIKIKADQTLITRLLINLIDNAINYNEKGGKVDVEILNEKNMAKIIIEDNGVGISSEDIPYVFDRFYQADSARNGHGTGLGLSIVKWIVDVHKGTILVESEIGKGTRFIVNLPLST